MPTSPRVALAVSLGLASALLCFHSLQFNFVTDDAFISFVYAKNLVEHGAPVSYTHLDVYKRQPYVPSAQESAEWRARGFHYVSVQVPGLSQPWYSFLKRIDRTLGPLPVAADATP